MKNRKNIKNRRQRNIQYGMVASNDNYCAYSHCLSLQYFQAKINFSLFTIAKFGILYTLCMFNNDFIHFSDFPEFCCVALHYFLPACHNKHEIYFPSSCWCCCFAGISLFLPHSCYIYITYYRFMDFYFHFLKIVITLGI